MRELKFQGCRRSGNHAIIEWVADHFKSAEFHNDLPTNWNGQKRKSQYLTFGEAPYELTMYSWEDKVLVDPEVVIILRSVYNCVASRLNDMKVTRKIEVVPVIWKQHATRLLEGHKGVLYDQWLNYQREAHQVLNLPGECQPVKDRKARRGNGSSFPGSKKYTERWKDVEIPEFILEDEELSDLNMEIFGWSLNKNGELRS